MFEINDESSFVFYAANHYQNPACFDVSEFYEDLKRFKYIKRLLNRYIDAEELKERLVLNHVIVLYNVFGIEHATKLLFYKLDNYLPYLKPFLELLNCLPDIVELKGKKIKTSLIESNSGITELLRNI